MASDSSDGRPINLLCFDGGGMRGLSSLIIIKRVMYTLERQLNLEPNSLLPCNYFDLIGGTSTGGLIAVMLGTLRMSVDSCIEVYKDLGKQIFPLESRFMKKIGRHGKGLAGVARFDAKVLEQCLKEIIDKYLTNNPAAQGPETKLDFEASRSTGDPKCKVFVCVTDKDTKKRFRLRSYDSDEPGTKCAIWQACRATTAAPTFFDYAEFGEPIPARYVDGGLGMNNPIRALIDEATRIWGSMNPMIGCVLSIGTGGKPIHAIGGITPSIAEALSKIATDTEETAHEYKNELRQRGPGFPNMKYFRMNVEQGVGDVGLEEWKESRRINQATNAYLNNQQDDVDKCAKAIHLLSGTELHENRDPTHRHSITPIATSTSLVMTAAPSRGYSTQEFGVGSHAPIPRFHNKHYHVPRNSSSVFTGREEILEQLKRSCLPAEFSDSQHQHQQHRQQNQQKRFVLHGLGGCGKTQLCLRFAEEHREKFWGIFWIDASSAENIQRDFLNIGRACNLEGDTGIIKRWLSNVPESWMLILDNADDPNLDLSPHIPVGDRGTILITIHATAGVCELGRLEQEEAITLLLKTVGHYDLSDKTACEMAKLVVSILGYLALAINQAGAVIRQGLYTMEEYCKVYSQRRKELLSRKPAQSGDDYEYTVYTTWEISLRMIESKEGETAQDAIELLQIFSFFHHDGISEEIFQRAWENLQEDWHSEWMRSHQLSLLRLESATWDARRLREGLSILSSFSLISRDKDKLVSIHPLVHTWARDTLNGSDEERMWTISTCIMAVSISREFQTADYRFWKLLVPHIDSCFNAYKDGIFRLRHVGKDYLMIAECFALAYGEVGRRQEALQLTETVTTARKRTLGDEHPDTLRSMNNLAFIYGEIGRRQEALQLTETVTTARKRTLDDEHSDTLRSMHNLALIYSEIGRRQEALQLTETVTTARKRTLGDEHLDTLRSMHNLAILKAMGDNAVRAQSLSLRSSNAQNRIRSHHTPTANNIKRFDMSRLWGKLK